MKASRAKRYLIGAGVVIAANLGLAAFTNLFSSSEFVGSFNSRYPNSQTANLASCQTCHGSTTTFLNGFGRAVQLRLQAGDSVTAALAAIESMNSDSDPGGASNITEINASTQPGWTAGNNTVYNRSTGATSTQTPPSSLTALDPPPPTSAPNISVSPLSLDFGAVTVASTVTRSATIQNTGNAALSVTSVSTSGTAEFSIDSATPGTPFTVAAGSSATVTVAYTPTNTGNDAGQLTIASNDPDTPSVSVTLSGSGTAPAGTCGITVTSSLAFGSVQTGQSSTLNAAVGNTGSAACTVSSLGITGTGYSVGSGAPATPFQVAVGATVNVPVTFAPTSIGASTGTLTVGSNDPNRASVTVPLNGTGIAAPVCAITLSGTSLSFGSITVGSNSTMSVQVQNTGTANCSVTGLTVTGTEFSLGSGAPSLPAQITPANSISVPVTFHPSVSGAVTGNLAVTSTDPNQATANVALNGTGQPAPTSCSISVDQPTIDFGSVTVATTANRTSIINNSGGAACTVNSLGVSGSGFALGSGAPATPFQVAAGGTASVPLVFTPGSTGPATGTLTINNSDASHATLTVALTGTGTAAAVCSITVSPLALDFGAVPVGSTVSRSTAVSNSGQADCSLNSLVLQGSSEFTLHSPAPTLPDTLMPGESVQIQVDFTPPDSGPDTATLTVGSSDPAQPSIVVSLAGTGVVEIPTACNIEITPQSLNFGSVIVGASAALSSTVRNIGSVDCTVSWSLSSTTSADFTLTSGGPALPVTLTPGASATASVTYTPGGTGADAGSLTITSNDLDTPSVSVSLAGNGIQSQGSIDLAIVRFRVTRWVTLPGTVTEDVEDDRERSARISEKGEGGRSRDEVGSLSDSNISIRLLIENRSSVSEPRQATVTGIQGGVQVYSQSLMVSAPANGGRATFQFPSFTPTATGDIRWTVVIADDVSAKSTASGVTHVVSSASRSDDGDDSVGGDDGEAEHND